MLVHSLDESFINFPEFRQRPSTSASEVLRSTEGSNVASVLFLLKNGDRQDQYRFRMIKHYFTLLFPTLRLEVRKPPQDQPRIVVEKRVTHHELPLDWIGAGIAEMIIILTHIVAERHKVIVLDEPELHLHPHSQRLLRDFLRQASKLNQIIVVTHSPQFVDPQTTESIIVVREITARSHIRKLAKNFLTEAQEHKVSQNLLAQEKEFLFSRSVLLVEGPTEYGAMSILAKRMKKGFDENGVSLVSVEGNYFGLMIRLLRGLGFSWSVMCDRDAVANISRGSIKVDGKEIKTSQVFHSLHDAGLLSPSEISELHHAQSQITLSKKGKSSAETYPVAQVTTLSKIAAAHRFNVLPTDFEGLFSKEGQGQLLRRAQEAYGRTKRLQGIYLAQYVKTVPLELRRVILQVTSSQ